jgi:hypothetical protein
MTKAGSKIDLSTDKVDVCDEARQLLSVPFGRLVKHCLKPAILPIRNEQACCENRPSRSASDIPDERQVVRVHPAPRILGVPAPALWIIDRVQD